jgi:hypothetical protein
MIFKILLFMAKVMVVTLFDLASPTVSPLSISFPLERKLTNKENMLLFLIYVELILCLLIPYLILCNILQRISITAGITLVESAKDTRVSLSSRAWQYLITYCSFWIRMNFYLNPDGPAKNKKTFKKWTQ